MRKIYYPDKERRIGKRIKDYIRSKNISQRQFADVILDGAYAHHMNKRLAGKTSISLGEYMAICEYLNVPYDYFLKEEENDKP